jgi:hypothetical protein
VGVMVDTGKGDPNPFPMVAYSPQTNFWQLAVMPGNRVLSASFGHMGASEHKYRRQSKTVSKYVSHLKQFRGAISKCDFTQQLVKMN